MTGTLTDAILQKYNQAVALCAATDNKVSTETSIREGQVSSLQDRVHALEVSRDEMAAELIAKETKITEQKDRIDVLVSQLTQLGVDAGI